MTMTSIRFFSIILLLTFCAPLLADKTDVVVLHNGDKITGEVKGLALGRLEFSTDSMGTLYIDWEDIRTVISETGHSIELSNGQRFFGPLRKPEGSDMVAIETGPGLIGVDMMDVVGMYPVERSFWQRLDVRISLGFSWDKASSIGKYNMGLTSEYRHPDHLTELEFNAEFTSQSNAETTRRSLASLTHLRFRPNNRYTAYFANLERNDELGIRLRSLVGIGYGWLPLRSNHNMLRFTLGADVNHETPFDGQSENNLEAVAAAAYEYYKYSDPERTFSTGLTVFPSITDWGRWRAEYNMDFDMEFKRDLSWVISLFASFDSDPLSEEGASSDYGIRSSLAYEW